MMPHPTLNTFASVAAFATLVVAVPLSPRAASLECCQTTIDPLSPLGITLVPDILQALGLGKLDILGLIGVNCVEPSLATVLNGQCTLTNVFTCQFPDVSVPILGGDYALDCQPTALTSLPL